MTKQIKRLSLLVLLIFSIVVFWYYLNATLFPVKTVVADKVFRGRQLSSEELERLINEKGIRSVINLRGPGTGLKWFEDEKRVTEKYKVDFYSVSLPSDDLPLYDRLNQLVEILKTAKRPVFIHCRRGIDRTGLASALALAIELDPPLKTLKSQMSIRYGLLPFDNSIGPILFKLYEQWLKQNTKKHSLNNLLYWIKNYYTDRRGNLKFWIDSANGRDLKGEKTIVLKGSKKVVIKGSVFDYAKKERPTHLSILAGNKRACSFTKFFNRPDVARYFNLGDKYYQNFPAGFEAECDFSELQRGCIPIKTALLKDGKESTFETLFRVCVSEDVGS
ncbi:MAG: hypothetical protein D6726_01135 [Nitrospirae bacterium]|nr:MAG: hypothetical protein D6726_01135 [Nitrospirota bacterium]